MAIYSLSTKPMSRKARRSAVAAAAYRSGSELTDGRTGVVHDYTRKRGVEHTEIVTRDGVPTPEREALWNQAEAAERRKDARVAREYLVALPHELNADQRLALARELAGELVERYGVAVDLAVHAPDPGGDQRNHHAHLLATTRCLNHDGLGDKATIELSDKKRRDMGLGRGGDEVTILRQRWESLANAALERADIAARIDCRSLAKRGIDRLPQIHVGNYGTQMIREGTPERSARAMLNLEIIDTNAQVQHLREQLDAERAVQEWAEITPVTPRSTVLELPEPVPSPAADAELAQARQSAHRDAQERIEQHIAGHHQLQIRADRRDLERVQTRVDARRQAEVEAQEQREWEEWIARPDVCSATGRIITELYVDACIERERALPQNQPPAQPQAKPELPRPQTPEAPAPRPQTPPPAASKPVELVLDAKSRALEIVMLETAAERHAALLGAARGNLDEFDALDEVLAPLLSPVGSLTPAGEQLRHELLSEPKHTSKASPATPEPHPFDWSPGNNGPGL